jgi:hypothetical protein
MTTIYLRFPSPQVAEDELRLLGLGYDSEGLHRSGELLGVRYDLDLIGEVWRPTGETFDDGEEVHQLTAPLPGYHVNFLWRGSPFLAPVFPAQFIVNPSRPERTFGA